MDHQLVPGPQAAANARMQGGTGGHAPCEQQAQQRLLQQHHQEHEVAPLNALDLDQLFQEGDDKTWDMADWNWDPYQMSAEPKSTPACTGCNALKRRRGTTPPVAAGALDALAALDGHGSADALQQLAASLDAGHAHQPHCQHQQVQPQQQQQQPQPQQQQRPYPHIGAIGTQPLVSAAPAHHELPWLGEHDTHLASILPPAPQGRMGQLNYASAPAPAGGMATAVHTMPGSAAAAQQGWGGAVGLGSEPAFVLGGRGGGVVSSHPPSCSAMPQHQMQQQLSFLPPAQQAALLQQINGDHTAQLPMSFSAAAHQIPSAQACHATGILTGNGSLLAPGIHLQRHGSVNNNNSMMPSMEHSSSHDSEDESTRGAVRLTTRGAGDVGDDEDKMLCQVPGCGKDLTCLKDYHQRYRICDVHIRLPQVLKDGRLQRFCQQCGRFHDLSAFDGNRKSCREQLQKHNARRRRRAQNEQEAAAAAAAPAGGKGAAGAGAEGGSGEEKGDVGKLLQTLLSNPQQLHALRVMLGIQTHPALPQPRSLPAEHTPAPSAGAAAAADGNAAAIAPAAAPATPAAEGCGEAASYSVAREVIAGAGTHGTSYDGEHRLLRLSVKLFNSTPADLPSDLKDQLTGWMAQAPAGMEGYIRPGCVLLSLHALVSNSCYYDAKKNGMARLLQRILGEAADPFWRAGVMLVQLLDSVAVISQGQLVSISRYGRAETQQQRLPRLARVTPVCLVGGSAVEFVLHGQNLHEDACAVAVKSRGSYVKAATQRVLDASGAQALRVCVQVPAGCRTLWVEVTSGAFVSQALPVLVVDDVQLAQEVRQLEQLSGDLLSKRQASALLLDIGLVLQHLAGMPAFPGLSHSAIAHKARRVLDFACDMGWVAVASRVLALVAAAPCECGAAVVSALKPAAASLGLLTPLHRAVRAGSLPLAQALLQWGKEVGCDWTLAKGPLGLTPLHLAALLDDDGAIALAVMDECEGGEGAFAGAATHDGVTPFHLAFQMGHYSVDRVLSCLHKEVKQVTEQEMPSISAYLKEVPGVWDELIKEEPNTTPSSHQSDHVEPCLSCHSTIPPLLLSIKAHCASCGERQPCIDGDCTPKAGAAAAKADGGSEQEGQEEREEVQAVVPEVHVSKKQRVQPQGAKQQQPPQQPRAQAQQTCAQASKPAAGSQWQCVPTKPFTVFSGSNGSSVMAQARQSLSRLACAHMSGKVLSLTALCQTCHANRVMSVA